MTRRPIFENQTFKLGKNFHFNACVGNNGYIDLHTYQLGYYEATIALINSAKKSVSNIDLLIYPIVYSARHTIELFIKNQLFKLGYINSKAKGFAFESRIRNIHLIDELWTEFKNLSAVDVRYKPYVNDLDEYILDFYEVDNSGETFRYPFSQKNIRHLSDLSCINIKIFEKRFILLYKIVDNLDSLTDFLINEYEQATVISSLSRQQIKEIALELPPKKDWVKPDFKTKKQKILQEYNISSKSFSKVLSLIQTHKEFSSYIGVEIPLKEISLIDLKEYITLYYKFSEDVKNGDYIELMNHFTHVICKKFTQKAICSLSTLFDIGYFHLYPETYDRILKEKLSQDTFDIVFDDLLDRGIVLEKIQIALKVLRQNILLQAFDPQ